MFYWYVSEEFTKIMTLFHIISSFTKTSQYRSLFELNLTKYIRLIYNIKFRWYVIYLKKKLKVSFKRPY